MSAPDAARDFCFICGHQREGHDDYNRKGDGSVDHPFVEPPTGNVFQRCGHCGPSLYDCPPCKSSAGMRAKMQDVRRKDAPREPVGRDGGFGEAVRCLSCPLLPDRYVICTRDCAVAERDADLRDLCPDPLLESFVAIERLEAAIRLAREARNERDALKAAARDALDEVEGWPHGPAFSGKREPYDAALARLRSLARGEPNP